MRLIRALPVLVALVAFGACGDDDEPAAGAKGSAGEGTQTLDAAVIPYSGLAATHLGIKDGLMAKHGLDMKFVDAEAPPAVVSQVISGQVDIGYVTTFSIVSALEAGADLKIIAPVEGVINPEESATEIIVPKDSDIESVKDLAGKKHGVVALSSAHDLLTREVVERAGGDPSTIEMVQVPFPQMATALKAGDVDAVTITEPFRTMALKTGAYRSISKPDAEVLPNGTATVWFASAKYVEDNTDVANRFHAAMCDSIRYADEHPKELRAVIPTFTELDAKLANEITISAIPEPDIDLDSLQDTADLMKKFGVIDEAPPMDDLVMSPTCA